MSKKKDAGTTFLIEIRTETQWRQLCRKEGLVVVEVYSGWGGSCQSIIVPFMKRMRADIVDKHESFASKINFATACADKNEDLLSLRNHAEPQFLFLAGGGKPVRIFKGCHIPNLANAVYDEFQKEMLVVEGKARRQVISIDDDETRKRKFEAEAQRLANMLKDDEPAPDPSEKKLVRRESSIMLETIMASYTIAVIQPFLRPELDEIKEFLSADFMVLGEATINIDDYEARKLYRIPFEVEDSGIRKSKNGDMPDDNEDGAPKKKVPVVLPDGVLGETTFLLLECTEIKNIIESGKKPSGALQTADDWLRLKVGPRVYEQALEHSPNSLHAEYGKGEFLSGVWCPRRYDDKRHILLTYFPEFLVEKVLPYEVGEQYVPKRYQTFIYPAAAEKDKKGQAQQKEILEALKNAGADVFAQGKQKIPPAKLNTLVKNMGLKGESADEMKEKLGGDLLCASVNWRNTSFVDTLKEMTLAPIHMSLNPVHGALETALLFPNLNAKYEEDADDVKRKFMGRAKKRIPDEVIVTEPASETELDGQKSVKNVDSTV